MTLKYDHLVGIPFKHGSTDCLGLVRHFYKDNFGIEIPDYARADDWWNKGQNLYMDLYPENGFYPIDVPIRDWRPGDLLLMGIQSNVANHAAVIVDDGMLLHHLWGRLSTLENYRPLYRNCTLATLRHKDVNIERVEKKVDLTSLLPKHLKDRILSDRPDEPLQ